MAKLNQVYFWLLSTIALLGYALFAFAFQRTAGLSMYAVYALLFGIGIGLTQLARQKRLHWWQVFAAGLLFRGVFLLSTPQLSDDYFRFTWDGELQKDGISSFAFTPRQYTLFFANDTLKRQQYAALYTAHSPAFPDGMNSRDYYSIYPTVNQTLFRLASCWGTPNAGNLILLRLFLILAEVLSFGLLCALLQGQNQSAALAGFVWLNPLLIIEVTGNLHFDGLALCFVLLSLYWLYRSAYTRAALALALAVCTKLNPLFLVGALFRKVPLKTFLWFGSVTVLGSLLLLSLCVDSETVWNFKQSFGLYFAWFEFNAGPYYLLREVGRLATGADLSPYLSLAFPVLTVLLFARVLWQTDAGLARRFLLLYTIYFSFSPVVHPWYIVVLLPLAVLSRQLYPLLWSLLIFFSYDHYREPMGESMAYVLLEYGLVYGLWYLESRGDNALVERVKDWCFGGAGMAQLTVVEGNDRIEMVLQDKT